MFCSNEQAAGLEGEIVCPSRPAFQSRLHGGLLDEGCDAVEMGSATVPVAVFGVSPDTWSPTKLSRFRYSLRRRFSVGETPTGATGTVALPIFAESLPLSTLSFKCQRAQRRQRERRRIRLVVHLITFRRHSAEISLVAAAVDF